MLGPDTKANLGLKSKASYVPEGQRRHPETQPHHQGKAHFDQSGGQSNHYRALQAFDESSVNAIGTERPGGVASAETANEAPIEVPPKEEAPEKA